jgi:hypothetical protein
VLPITGGSSSELANKK